MNVYWHNFSSLIKEERLMVATFTYIKLFSLALLITISSTAFSQDEVLNNGRQALKSGSAKELARYFSDIVEISFDGAKANYSKTQAEFVLKDFFRRYPPVGFEYIHQGSSKEGLKYAIGKYTYNGGHYRVYMLIKKINGVYVIDTLEFSKDLSKE